MKNRKFSIIIATMIFVLLILPLTFINLAQPHEFMGVMILLFFVVNPIAAVIVSSMVGKDIKKLWWLPMMFCIIFLLSYWFVLKEIILDLIVYAIMYLIIGLIFMFISLFVASFDILYTRRAFSFNTSKSFVS